MQPLCGAHAIFVPRVCVPSDSAWDSPFLKVLRLRPSLAASEQHNTVSFPMRNPDNSEGVGLNSIVRLECDDLAALGAIVRLKCEARAFLCPGPPG
jgi:hypothetical protein